MAITRTDTVMMGLPLLAGAALLLLRINDLKFYSLESPIAWAFLAFGIAIGTWAQTFGKPPEKCVCGVPVRGVHEQAIK